MFFKANIEPGIISPQATCPGITCSYNCQNPSVDLKITQKVSADENKASVKNTTQSPTTA